MQKMSDEFNDIVEHGNALYYITITDADRNTLDLQIDDFEYIGIRCSDNNISFGNTPAQSVKFSVHNPDISLENKEIEIKQGLYVNGELESLKIGYFTIQKPTSDGEVTQYIGYDRMVKFEKAYFTSLTDYKISAILSEIESQIGVKINLPDGTDYTLKKKPDGYTCREIMGYIAGLYGCDAFVSREGEIVFKWYSKIDYTIDGNRIYQGETNIGSEYNYILQKIECTVTGDDKDITLIVGAGTQGISIENPFMTQTILNNIFDKINGFEFRPLSTEFLGDFRLDLGDIITVIKDNVSYKMPIMEIRHQSDGGVRTTITANAETESEQEFDVKGPSTKAMERYHTDLVLINKALINKLDVEIARITYATINELEAINVKIDGKLEANELEAKVAVLGYLKADEADITYATITSLNSIQATIADVNAQVIKTNTLIFGSATGDIIQTNFSNSVIAQLGDAQIKSAMIDSIVADKITGLDLNTSKFTVHSEDGRSTWKDNTIQISDTNRVRVQIGKDALNDYNLYVWDASGRLMFDALGLTADGINRQIIDNNVVKDNAGIEGSKLDIDSVVTAINGSSTTLKSSKIYFDDEKQTLDVSFKALTTNVTTANANASNAVGMAGSALEKAGENEENISLLSQTVTSQGTNISVLQGQISSKIWQQDITTAVSGVEIGGRNYIINSDYKNGTASWNSVNNSQINIATINERKTLTGKKGSTNNLFMQKLSNFKYAKGESIDITVSAEIYADEAGSVLVDTLTLKYKSIAKSAKYISNTLKEKNWIKFIANIELYSDDYEGDIIVTFRTTATTIYMYHPKLEKGNKATDYSPAPEDTDDEIGILSTKYSTLEQNLDGFKTTVSNTYATQIAVTNLSNNLTNNYSTTSVMNSAISQSVNELSATVSSTYTTISEFNNLAIGGTNLFVISTKQTGYIDDATGGVVNSKYYYVSDYIEVEGNAEYCYQMWRDNDSKEWYSVHYYDGEKKYISNKYVSTYSTEKHVVEKVTTHDDAKYVRLSYRNIYERVKFEKGNKPTDYSLAMEDTQYYVDKEIVVAKAEITATTDSISLEVSKKVNENEIINKINLSTESATISANKINLTGYLTISSANSTYATQTDFNNLKIGGRNLLILKSLSKGYLNQTTGVFKSNSDYYLSDYISIEAGADYIYQLWKDDTGNYWYGAYFFTSSKSYIASAYLNKYSAEKHTQLNITVSDNAAYVRICYHKNFLKAKFEKGNRGTDYSPSPEDISVENIYVSGTTTINGGFIATNTITADKLNVADLSAIGATIGGWQIDNAIYSDYVKGLTLHRVYIQPINTDTMLDTWVFSSQYYSLDSSGQIADGGIAWWYITVDGEFYTEGPVNINNNVDIGGDAIIYNHDLSVHRNTISGGLGIGTVVLRPHGGIELYHSQGGFIDWHYANSSADYTARILESSSGKLTAYNSISNASDRRLKKDISKLDDKYLKVLENITPVSYRYIKGDKYLNAGFIAQDVEGVMNNCSITDMAVVSIDDEGLYSLDYSQISTLCVLGYQDNKSRIKDLEQQMQKFQFAIKQLTSEIQYLKAN